MVSDAPQGFITGVIPYHWTQVVNIKRDPFETSLGPQAKTLFGQAGAQRHEIAEVGAPAAQRALSGI